VNTRPRWMLWVATTVVACAGWVVFGYLPLKDQNRHREAELAESAGKRLELMQRISLAPQAIARLEDMEHRLDSALHLLPQHTRLDEYLDGLSALGAELGLYRVDANPQLSSMMELTSPDTKLRVGLDTLMLEVSASGGFQQTGAWLEAIERDRAFRRWQSLRWAIGESGDDVTVTGSAAVVVAISQDGRS
jgi:hypothetical protein